MKLDDFTGGASGLDQGVNKFAPDAGSVRKATSTYGKALPLVWGQPRIPANAVANLRYANSGQLGTFQNSYAFYGVCEGPIAAFRRVWALQNLFKGVSSVGGVTQEFLGSYSQNPAIAPFLFSGLVPARDLSYRGLAYIMLNRQSLAPTTNVLLELQNFNFEVATATQVGSITQLVKVVTADSSADTLNATAHGFAEFQNIRIESGQTMPGGLVANADYVCANVTANAFQLKQNPWDASVIDLTSNGSGTITATPFVLDANPKVVVTDFLTNVKNGVGFPSAQIGDLTAFGEYCHASGSFVSPGLEAQESARSFLERLAIVGFSGLVFSEGVLKIIPYCDTAITGYGETFTPTVSAVYPLTDDDFAPNGDEDPVAVKRIAPGSVYNAVKVEFQNRLNQYSVETVEIRNEASILKPGGKYRPKDTLKLHEIKDPAVAKWVATLVLFREENVRNTYSFRLPKQYLLLEPMDLLTLTESTGTPLVNVPVRITETNEESDGFISVTAEDFPTGVAIGVAYPNQMVSAYSANFNSDPGSVNVPVFVGPYVLSLGVVQIWIGLSGKGNYGGCEVWGSYDQSDGQYRLLGRMLGRTTTGFLTTSLPAVADPDNTTTLGVDLAESEGSLASVSGQQAANGEFSLCYAGGELFSFTNVVKTGSYQYNLVNLRRGLFGTPVISVPSGSRFMFVNDPFFRFAKPPEFTIGRTLYLKFPAFNQFGAGQQALSDVSAYPIVSAASTPIVIGETELPPDVLSFTIEGEILSWTLVADAIGYRVRYQPGTSRSWGDAIPLHTGLLTNGPFDMLIVPVGPVTIMIKAVNSQRGVNPEGNESLNAAFIVTDLGDPIVANIVETFDRKAAGFPGVKTNCSVVGGNLEADSITPLMWKPDDSAAMWDADATKLMWATVQYAQMTYVDGLSFSQAGEGSQLTIEHTILGDPWSLEYRENSAKLMWDPDPSKPMWSGNDAALMWDEPAFLPWPGQIAVKNSMYDFRINAGQANTQGRVTEFTLVVDMPDIDEVLDDIVISSGGTRLPITKSYRAIKNVQLTVQADGGSAISARTDDKHPVLGPLIHGLDAAGANTSALVDAHIQGY